MICRMRPRAQKLCRPSGMQGFSSSPLLVFYELTQACDLACQHCRASAQCHPSPDELSTEESLWMIAQLAEFDEPPHLVLTGGDPLKRLDVYQLIEHAVNVGISVSITPSATPLATSKAIRRLKNAGISRIAVSIDGADPQTHDRNRGVTGSFERSLEILHQAHMFGISTQINTTISPQNCLQINRMAEVCDHCKIDLWSVFFLVPVGRARYLPQLTAIEYECVFESLWQQSQRRSFAIKTTEAPHFRRYVAQRQKSLRQTNGPPPFSAKGYVSMGVNDGKGVMFIGHTGVISPSGFLPLKCGQFPQDNLVRVYQESTIFRDLRNPDLLQGKCGKCEFRHICGGSRARAFAMTGNLFSEEPCCSYIPKSPETPEARNG